ncbi:retrovirus-related pol polyprotein from transposon TNT 1-94 [Tanacetum coccineum]
MVNANALNRSIVLANPVRVTAQILPHTVKSILKNTNVIALGMYKVHTKPNQTRTLELPQDIRKTNKRVSFSIGVIPTTSVSRPQLKSNQMEDRVMHNNSQGKKQQVEYHLRNFKFSNNKTSVTACNDSLNAKTSTINFVCVTYGKCVLNENHDMYVLHYINGVNTMTKQPIDVPISTRKPIRTVNQSVATPLKKTITSKSTHQKPKSKTRKQYEHASTVKFGNDQIASILGYRDLVQGNITIKRGNDLLTGSHGTYLYSITLQDTSIPISICLMAKASSSQARLWHRRLLHLKFDTINLISKYDIVTGLPKLKFIKDHLCSSCELGKEKYHVNSNPIPQYPRTALKQGSLSPGPQSQENVPQAAETVTTSNDLDILFSPMFNELLNGTTTIVSKSSAVTAADAPNQRQQQNTTPYTSTIVAVDKPPLNIHTTPDTTTQAPTVTSIENINQAEINK